VRLQVKAGKNSKLFDEKKLEWFVRLINSASVALRVHQARAFSLGVI
jgi:hypothetical protein